MAKKYTAKQYNNLKKQLNSAKSQLARVQQQLKDATTSYDVMNKNLANASAELNKYRDINYEAMERQARLQEEAMQQAASAQQENYAFNSAEAEKLRLWQEQMSATAHQREVNDLEAAGLNPVISAYGNGASVGSGAAASASNNLTGALGGIAAAAVSAIGSMANAMDTNATSYLNTVFNQATAQRGQDMSFAIQKYAADLSSETNISMNEATNEMQKYIARINNLNNQEVAEIAAKANLTSAQIHAAAQNYSAELSYAAAQMNYAASQNTNSTNKEIAEMQANKTFEGLGSTLIQKAGKAIVNFLLPGKAY